MMRGFALHPDAYRDLEEIWGYIAADNPDAADRILEEIQQAIGLWYTFLAKGTGVVISPRDRFVFTLCEVS